MKKEVILYGISGLVIGALVTIGIMTSFSAKQSVTAMTMDDMTQQLAGKKGSDFDQAFLSMMIEHHRGAVEMAELAKHQAHHSEVVALANDIMTLQSKEIAKMQKWQSLWGYAQTSEHANHMMHQ